MSVTTVHPLYAGFTPIWKLTRDAVVGNPAIKAGGTTYLPADFATSDTTRYAVYQDRAYFMGVTAQTQDATIGMVFRKPSAVDIPTQLEALSDNIDGSGQSLDQVAKFSIQEVEEVGRIGYLADFSAVEGEQTRASEAALGVRPYMNTYTAESIINWKNETIGGKSILTLVVLKEEVEDNIQEDEFSHDFVCQYRVLRLRDGVYTQQLYDEGNESIGDEKEIKQAGKTIDHIPFYFAGANNNLPEPDMPMLYDIALVNIAHYQTTADHRENLFVHGQLTMGISTNLDYEEFRTANPNGVTVGAREGIFLGETGTLQEVTAPESSSLRMGLEDLKSEMRDLGARMVQDSGQAETAEAARINASAQSSTLNTVVTNVSDAMTDCLKDMALFLGASEDLSYMLNTDFWESSLDPQLVAGLTTLQATQNFSKQDVAYSVANGRIAMDPDQTPKDRQAAIANELLDE